MKSGQSGGANQLRPAPRATKPLALALGGVLLLTATVAQSATIIDEFDGSVLNPTIWRGGWFTNHALELRRRVKGGALHMSLYSRGDTTANGGRTNVKNQVIPVDAIAGNLKRVTFDVTPLKAAARHCATGDQDSRARLGMTVTWMNDGSSTGPDDLTGNIGSFIEVRSNPGNTKDMEIKPLVWRCDDATCSSRTELARAGTPTLGRIHFGFSTRLRMSYDATSNSVEFETTTPDGAYAQSAPVGAISSVNPPVKPVVALEARTEVDNCNLSVSGVQTPFAQVSANITRIRLDTN